MENILKHRFDYLFFVLLLFAICLSIVPDSEGQLVGRPPDVTSLGLETETKNYETFFSRHQEKGMHNFPEVWPLRRVATYFVERGTQAESEGDYHTAGLLFEQALEITPLEPLGYFYLGRLKYLQGNLDEALTFLTKTDLLLGQSSVHLLGETACLLGAIYEETAAYDRATLNYQRCLDAVPENLRAISGLARLSNEGS